MGGVASGITVVTTNGPGGLFGQTVSSFCSVSADPPQVLVCLRKGTPTADAIAKNQCFTVNILSEEQSYIADTFAGRRCWGAPYDFGIASYDADMLGCPVFTGVTATLSCLLVDAYSRSTHFIYVGRVVSAEHCLAPPLLYRARSYGRFEARSEQSVIGA
jgi:flavin reductase